MISDACLFGNGSLAQQFLTKKQKRKKKKEKTMCQSLTLHFGAGRLLSWIRNGARPDALQATVLFRWMGAEFSSEGGRHCLFGNGRLAQQSWNIIAGSSSRPVISSWVGFYSLDGR